MTTDFWFGPQACDNVYNQDKVYGGRELVQGTGRERRGKDNGFFIGVLTVPAMCPVVFP